MNYLELFSGIGGFRRATELISNDTGFKFNCIGFSEINTHALATYYANYSVDGETPMNDITKFAAEKRNIRKLGDIDLLLGGFPCQSFSLLGKQLGLDDERGKILFSIHEILKTKKPKFIVLENVRNIMRLEKGTVLNEIISFFKGHGYKYVQTVLLDTQHFGLPQRRSRVFFICSRKQLDLDITEQEVIKNFRSIKEHSLKTYSDVRQVLSKSVEEKYYLSSKIKKTILADGSKNFESNSQIDLNIARTLTATMIKMHRACQDNYYSDDFILEGKSHMNTPKSKLMNMPIRKLTPLEALKLQGFDFKFYQKALKAGVSNRQLTVQAGNALSVNTGYALLHYLFVKRQIHLM